MKLAAALTIAAAILSGCIVTRPLRTDGEAAEVYTREQVDFLLLQAHCRANARTLVQLRRCEVH